MLFAGIVAIALVVIIVRIGLEPTPTQDSEAGRKWQEDQDRQEEQNRRLHEQTKGKWWR